MPLWLPPLCLVLVRLAGVILALRGRALPLPTSKAWQRAVQVGGVVWIVGFFGGALWGVSGDRWIPLLGVEDGFQTALYGLRRLITEPLSAFMDLPAGARWGDDPTTIYRIAAPLSMVAPTVVLLDALIRRKEPQDLPEQAENPSWLRRAGREFTSTFFGEPGSRKRLRLSLALWGSATAVLAYGAVYPPCHLWASLCTNDGLVREIVTEGRGRLLKWGDRASCYSSEHKVLEKRRWPAVAPVREALESRRSTLENSNPADDQRTALTCLLQFLLRQKSEEANEAVRQIKSWKLADWSRKVVEHGAVNYQPPSVIKWVH